MKTIITILALMSVSIYSQNDTSKNQNKTSEIGIVIGRYFGASFGVNSNNGAGGYFEYLFNQQMPSAKSYGIGFSIRLTKIVAFGFGLSASTLEGKRKYLDSEELKTNSEVFGRLNLYNTDKSCLIIEYGQTRGVMVGILLGFDFN